ncbi:MAG: HesA/MoeB/ThiF family protein [Nanoarchaeota archaeon]
MDYSRQELYLGKKDSNSLRGKTACIVGLGALGSRVADLLARSGVNLKMIDRDIVEESNLQRQSLFFSDDVGKSKAKIALERLRKVNNKIRIESHDINLDKDNARLLDSDIVVDCTDNFLTRFLINDYCRKNRIKWIHGSAIENKGFLFNVIPGGACFRCVFNNLRGHGTCDTIGVLNTVTSLMASMQASEAIKILLGKNYERGLVYINLEKNDFRKFRVKKNKKCRTCNGSYEYLSKDVPVVSFCGSNKFQFKGKFDVGSVEKRLNGKFNDWVIKSDRIIIRARDEDEALKLFSKYIGD